MRSILGLLLSVPLLLAACGKTATVNESSTTGVNYDAEEETSSSIGVSFAGDDEAALEAADKLVRNGDYARAVDAYRRVYENGNRNEDVRADALFRMASAQGNPLNPQRDYAAAIGTLERFLEEFSDHRLQYEAREKITGYRLLLVEGGD